MNKVYLLVSLMFCLINLNAQECGFTPPESYETFEQQEQARMANNTFLVPENYCINVCFRIVRDDNGSNAAADPSIIPQVMAQLNSKFNPHGISFVQIGTYDYINNTNYNYQNSLMTVANSPGLLPNRLNIFFVKNFDQLGQSYCGTGTSASVKIKGTCALVNNTSAHEVGHALNLLHTFTGSNPYNGTIAESPYTSEGCDVKGDKICDTPADYNPYATNNNLIPFPLTDYNPDKNNIMSQWPSTVYFSLGQVVRMKAAINNNSPLQPYRSYQCTQISGTSRVCPYAFNSLNQIIVPTYTFSVPNYGTGNTFTWSIIGNSNLQFVGSNTSNTVQITNNNANEDLTTAALQVIVNTSNGTYTLTKNVLTVCFIKRIIGLYDWVSIDYGNMGLIVPVDNQYSYASYQWEITEDESRVGDNENKSKPHFVGANVNEPNKYTSATNQAVVNWGNASSSYLVTCYGVTENGSQVALNYSYVDVGDPKNNPCFKDAISTVVAPNPIQNGIVHVILNKPSHTSPCNYKNLSEPQFFNSEIDQINNSVSIYDYSGNEVYRKVFDTNEFTIDDATLRSGNNYIVNLFTKEGGFTQQVIIVE